MSNSDDVLESGSEDILERLLQIRIKASEIQREFRNRRKCAELATQLDKMLFEFDGCLVRELQEKEKTDMSNANTQAFKCLQCGTVHIYHSGNGNGLNCSECNGPLVPRHHTHEINVDQCRSIGELTVNVTVHVDGKEELESAITQAQILDGLVGRIKRDLQAIGRYGRGYQF
jgi:hypothetical protein